MKPLTLTYLFLFIIIYTAYPQEYSYTHYDITEGLASSTVYCITQDKDGFIWMGTETGVSRFDGTHFLNYTTVDGLPDIEVLKIFGDSKGRVWMAPFRKSICYYYKSKIHNQDNDSLLRRMRFNGNIESFAEDNAGNILIQERTRLHLLRADGTLEQYDSIENHPIEECWATGKSSNGSFDVQAGKNIFELSGKEFHYRYSLGKTLFSHSNLVAMSPHWVVWKEDSSKATIGSLTTPRKIHIPYDSKKSAHISFSIVDDSLVYSNSLIGVAEFNLFTGRTRFFLPGRPISRTFRDDAGNLWFTSLGQGVFRLNSDGLRTARFIAGDDPQTGITTISKIGPHLWVGTDHEHFYRLSLPGMDKRTSFGKTANNDILFLDTISSYNHMLMISKSGPQELYGKHLDTLRTIFTNGKSIFRKNNGLLLYGATWGVAFFNKRGFRFVDTLWRERVSTVYSYCDTDYIGTLNGLYRVLPDRTHSFPGKKIPFLRKRISSLVESSNHILWAASYDDAGVIGIRGDSIVATLTKKQGLSSDIVHTLAAEGNLLWIGTDKGLNKVRLDKPGYPVTRYTSLDGLSSDIIKILCIDSPMIYVGTSSGLSYFDQNKIKETETCRLFLMAALNAGRDRITDTPGLRLDHKRNDIRWEFAGISYRSAGNITYKYRMLGLDTAWKETKDTYLDYPTLPSGSYTFQLQAINRFGNRSNSISIPFEVETPFWKTVWFDALLLVIFLSLIWLFVFLRIKSIRRRQEEKNLLSQRMIQLEHKALQAQMNPHFIFNCLNSIQQYIFDQDIFKANKYITGFAKLIRATLQNSSVAVIPLSEEISFLSYYLSLEKLRFKDKMDYSFDVDPSIDTQTILIPPMLIQPYVENSMRHGLRHRTTGNGNILIRIRKIQDHQLEIIVEDNGIGREKAARYKTAEHIEYQSKGMLLTAERIRLINTTYQNNISIQVIDLKNDQGQAAGTRVVMNFQTL